MRNDVKSIGDCSQIVEVAINKPAAGEQLCVLTSPILLNELCDIIVPGIDPLISNSDELH